MNEQSQIFSLVLMVLDDCQAACLDLASECDEKAEVPEATAESMVAGSLRAQEVTEHSFAVRFKSLKQSREHADTVLASVKQYAEAHQPANT